MCILIVEDDDLIRMILVEDLLEAGYQVRQASSGDEAVAMIDTIDPPPKVVVTDIHMPGQRDGLAVGAHVREHLPHVPVIYTTGRPEALQRTTLGVNQALMRKPYRLTDLVARIEKFLAA